MRRDSSGLLKKVRNFSMSSLLLLQCKRFPTRHRLDAILVPQHREVFNGVGEVTVEGTSAGKFKVWSKLGFQTRQVLWYKFQVGW